MNQRRELLSSIAKTIQNYRDGILPRPIADHVERWIQQFNDDVQIPILNELDHVLKRTYFSKQRVLDFLRKLIYAKNIAGDNPKEFWRSANFLDIQGGGNSQRDMLALFSKCLGASSASATRTAVSAKTSSFTWTMVFSRATGCSAI